MIVIRNIVTIFIGIFLISTRIILAIEKVDSVRVVRISVLYPNANIPSIPNNEKWQTTMRKSILASLKFINKHWNICNNGDQKEKSVINDCGKLQVTGEEFEGIGYRINATFTAKQDPIKNVKVSATSSLKGVVNIGLKGGIFQYTNTLKILGKPSSDLKIEEDYFCYPGTEKINQQSCYINDPIKASQFIGV
uniref:DUF2807 domain-containing protein n=1 Tax=Parastrongyloides trichosuri TaxID=131310 RepID=A0A0N4Z4A5_PARTI